MTRQRLAWITPWIALLVVLACATTSRSERARRSYRFPSVFQANQIVRVTLLKVGALELLGSIRRTGGDYDVTLFDPLFVMLLLAASSREGAVTEDLLAPSAEAGWGIQLLSLLREVYGETYLSQTDDTWDASSRAASLRLSKIDLPDDACAFPKVIEVRPRRGAVQSVRVETLQVNCQSRDAK
jgi:hypothetical protein